jgi:transcriptional repressor NrdR
MRCPKCGNRDDKVIDSRQSRDSSSIRRRRVCLACSYRFTTYEEIERSDLRVIKRDRRHEIFDRRKLANSIAKACEKRSISLSALEQTVDDIVHEIETSGREITSSAIGEPRCTGISKAWMNSLMKFRRSAAGSNPMQSNPSCLAN